MTVQPKVVEVYDVVWNGEIGKATGLSPNGSPEDDAAYRQATYERVLPGYPKPNQ